MINAQQSTRASGTPAPFKRPEFITGTALQAYLPAEQAIDEALRQGHSHTYIDFSQPSDCTDTWTSERLTRVRRQLEQSRISPICHGNFKFPLASDVASLAAAAAQEAKREVNIAAALRAAHIVHGGGVVEPRKVREARTAGMAHLVEGLRDLQQLASHRGVPLWLENLANYGVSHHPHYYQVVTVDECANVLDQVPGISMILDVSHMHVNGGDPVAAFARLHTRIAAMSFSDNYGDRDSHLPLGRGSVDYAGLLDAIACVCWQGPIGFETRGSELAESLAYLTDLAARPERAQPASPLGNGHA